MKKLGICCLVALAILITVMFSILYLLGFGWANPDNFSLEISVGDTRTTFYRDETIPVEIAFRNNGRRIKSARSRSEGWAYLSIDFGRVMDDSGDSQGVQPWFDFSYGGRVTLGRGETLHNRAYVTPSQILSFTGQLQLGAELSFQPTTIFGGGGGNLDRRISMMSNIVEITIVARP